MIRLHIEVEEKANGDVSVNARTDPITGKIPDNEAALFAGLAKAINEFMHARGAKTFDCLQLQSVATSAPRTIQ